MTIRFSSCVATLACICLHMAMMTYSPHAGADEPEQLDVPTTVARLPSTEDLDQTPDDLGANPFQRANTYGEVEIFRERYPDGKVKTEREVTLDADGNYVNHGSWKMWNVAGNLIAEGHFNMGRRVGVWTRWLDRKSSPELSKHPFNRFKTPYISQAAFTDDVMDGDWLIFDAEQKKCAQVSLKNGKRQGPAIIWLPNGKIYRQATYEMGVPVGDVFQQDNSGELKKVATYNKGRKVITKVSHFPRSKQKKTEAFYLEKTTTTRALDDFWTIRFVAHELQGEDLRHGVWKTWHTNGQLSIDGQYEQDKRVGFFTYWYPNGQKSAEGQYRDDQPHGTWVWWHENGQKATAGEYRDGEQIGEWRWWGANGKLTRRVDKEQSESIGSTVDKLLTF